MPARPRVSPRELLVQFDVVGFDRPLAAVGHRVARIDLQGIECKQVTGVCGRNLGRPPPRKHESVP